MNHGSLFSGMGGFDLAAEWMGWENVFHCEISDFGQKILKYYWPNAISYADITKTDFTIWRGQIDILTGGFPCQPYSIAGLQKGVEDDRHLWPEMRRAIREIQPGWVVGENVRGLVSWNGGMVFEQVQADLEAEGYEVLPFLLPAAGVNAPHRRDRIWFVSYSLRNRLEGMRNDGLHPKKELSESPGLRATRPSSDAQSIGGGSGFGKNANNEGWQDSEHFSKGAEIRDRDTAAGRTGLFTDSDSELLKGRSNKKQSKTTKQHISTSFCRNAWENFSTQSPICTGDDGFSSMLDGITFSKWRNESIEAAGNAVVPQVVYQIFKAIEAYELQRTN